MTRGYVAAMRTPAQLIDGHGGPAAFARAIGSTSDAVRQMKFRNKLPRSVWPEVMTAFPDLTLKVLQASEVAAKRRVKRLAAPVLHTGEAA